MTHTTQVAALLVLGLSLTGSADATAGVRSTSMSIDEDAEGLTIHIDGIQVQDNTLETKGDRIFIGIDQDIAAQQIRLDDDKTVKMVEIAAGRRPRISVQLRHGRSKTEIIGSHSTIENIEGGIVIHVPRWPIREEVVSIAAVKPAVAAAPPQVPAPVQPEPKTEIEAVPTPVVEAAAEAPAAPEAADPIENMVFDEEDGETPIAGKTESEGGVSFGLIAGLLLLLVGGGVLTWRSRRKSQGAEDVSDLRVVATKQLGVKSKIVWLNVGERQMIVAVSDGGTRLLSQWRRPSTEASKAAFSPATESERPVRADGTLPRVYDFQAKLNAANKATDEDVIHSTKKPSKVARQPTSPAVAGLIRLRGEAPTVNVDVATQDEDADAEWARELLRASRETMLRRAE